MNNLATLIELFVKWGLEPSAAVDKAREDCARMERHEEEMAKIALETAKFNASKQGCVPFGKKLKDGIPELQQNLTASPPSVPSEKEHAFCHRHVLEFPCLHSISEEVLNSSNLIWVGAYTRETGDKKFLYYASGSDIVFYVRTFLKDILLALNLRLDFNSEVAIKQIRPDICVLLNGMYLVGVVEVKKPGRNVLLEPTVLGELLDQMMLVEGFYGMGPIIGILTTGDEWLVSWFPIDSQILVHAHAEPPGAPFTTPEKKKATSSSPADTKGHSPPGGTPSQQRGVIHFIDELTDLSSDFDDDNVEVTQEMDRLLCTSDVMNINEDPIRVLQHLCGAFELMSKAHMYHTANLSRCLLKFHKGAQKVTFHPVSYDVVHSQVNFDKFPNKSVKTLVALEDLGRGSTGKAWLCVTVTKPRSASCVLKFDNDKSVSSKLLYEREMWHLLYPEFSMMVKLENWSGADALVMPHFSAVLESEREQYRDELLEVLNTHFFDKGKVHRDVRWRNIGKYCNRRGAVSLVVFDLNDVVNYDVAAHLDWIDTAIKSLFMQ